MSEAATALEQRTRVSRINVGRVYNLGNYENERVEISVEIASGDDPTKVLVSLENILADLRAEPAFDSWQVSNARKLLAKPEEELADGDRARLEKAREVVTDYDAAMKRRESARLALSTLNYTREHRDAKDSWEDDGDDRDY